MGVCKDCTRRKVGCHNVETCPDWKAHVEALKAKQEAKQAEKERFIDWQAHVKRRTKGSSPWYDFGDMPR